MQILNEIRNHLESFETAAKDEIHRFIDWLQRTKYIEPGAPVVSEPNGPIIIPVIEEQAPAIEPPAEVEAPAEAPLIDPILGA